MKGSSRKGVLVVIAVVMVTAISVGLGLSVCRAAGPGGRTEGREAVAVPAATTRVWLEPAAQVVNAGETFTVTLMIEDADDLAGYEFDLAFDARLLEAVDAEDASFLGSTGRQVVELDEQIKPWLLSYAVFSLGTTEPGVDGDGPLAVITMEAGRWGGSATLDVREVQLFDTGGVQYEDVVVEDGSVAIEGPEPMWVFLPLVLRIYEP
ncbi:MAG: cohesin domain-containing protein [Anaerolineae bacterium]|jgi:general secretion pathway protein D